MQFEWDDDKEAENLRRHNVTFWEAMTVFEDTLSANVFDEEHSEGEDRFLIIGLSRLERPLLVCYTERSNKIRIISARKLTRRERRDFEDE